MISSLLAKIFGTKNNRELKKIEPIVQRINALEPKVMAVSDAALAAHTNHFRERISRGESLDDILPEAFAVVREAGRRSMNMRHYDVQLIGGITLHQGKIAEMRTGEGKTLVATLPLYLNALAGKGAHLVTVNDYLARRDAEWMKPLYNLLGLEVGIIQNSMEDQERKRVYNADITYGTNNEFGFDYLRDNMKFNLDDYVQRDLHFAIVDEVDSILIDEARTPLIISGATQKSANLYQIAQRSVAPLSQEADYEVDEKIRSVQLTEDGMDRVERSLGVDNLYSPDNILILHHVTQALRAKALFKNDVDYVVRDGEVLIVDEFTGRILPGRRYSDGLHQALEAKEGVRIERENQTLASITLQNLFRMYSKLAGMTGTAATEAAEFHKIYKLDVITIPTHQPMIRHDEPDIIFLTRADKFQAVVEDIKNCHGKGQPVLVGTIAIETSEMLSNLLRRHGVAHNVLNAKHHEKEAEIVAEAGQIGKVTIATNMAGRGTDIKLGSGVKEVGGLRIIGTERHESRRIDNQLRGRAGRQGDPGSTKFYVSLEDDLMRIFGGERLKNTMERVGMKEGESIEHPMISRSIERAQEKVEKQYFETRKHLIEYDDVLNQQRAIVYQYRREILNGGDMIMGLIKDLIADVVHIIAAGHIQKKKCSPEEIAAVYQEISSLMNVPLEMFEKSGIATHDGARFEDELTQFLIYTYEQFKANIASDIMRDAEKWILLETVDQHWKLHLQNIDQLKEGIGLRGYGQKNPLIEYKREAFVTFESMMSQIRIDVMQHLFRIRSQDFSAAHIQEIEHDREKELASLQMGGSESASVEVQPTKRVQPKVGRNDPCSCGSGKKYKQCCGR